MSFWGELKRRNVFKVGAVYVIVAWVILQAVSIIFPLLHLPEWTGTFVTVLILIGFPVTLIIAWAFELTAEGVKRTSDVPHDESITHVTGRKINYVLGGLLVMAMALLIFDNYYLDRRVVKPEVASTVAEQTSTTAEVEESPKTIAVLPFADMSPEKDQEYFVDGLSEELLNCLAKIEDLKVTSRTSSFAFKKTDKTLQEVAGVLGVEHVLEGSVRKAGAALRITAQLIRVKDDSHLWSETYDRELKDIFELQEDIATAVANELKVKLGIGETFKQLGGTDNLEAYELYLAAKGQLYNPGESWFHAYESINAAIYLDPEFALAWALKGFFQMGLTTSFPDTRPNQTSEMKEAKNAALKAIELETNLPEAYVVLGHINMVTGNWIEAESALQKAIVRKTDHLWGLELVFGSFYDSVGYLKKAKTLLEKMCHDDPLSMPVRSSYILNLVSLDDLEEAEEVNRRGKALVGDQWETDGIGITYLRLMNDDDVNRDEIVYPDLITDAVKDLLGSREKALSTLRQLYSTENKSFAFFGAIAVWASYFDDADFALDAIEKAAGNNQQSVVFFWLPVMHEVRQLPRFKEFVREIGLVDYWEKFGWPDLCHPTDNGDFVCD